VPLEARFEATVERPVYSPLGPTAMSVPAAATVNLIGPAQAVDPARRLAEVSPPAGASVHLYGKSWRPGRKLGHVTAVGEDPATVLETARSLAAALLS